MVAFNSFCYRAMHCLEDAGSRDAEIKIIKDIAKNNKYKIDKIVKRINSDHRLEKEKIEKIYKG